MLLNLINSKCGIINTGGPHTPFAFTLNDTEAGLSATFLTPSVSNPFSLSTVDGGATPFGTFGISILKSGGNGSGNGYYGDLEFNLIRASGLSTTVFTANSLGYYFGADLTNGQNTGSQGWNIRTMSTVPEPASVALMASGLLALSVVARRKRA